MNNINTVNSTNNINKSSFWKNLSYALSIIALLNLSNPSEAKTVNTNKFTPEIIKVLENSDIITNIKQRTGVKLPKGYTEKIRNFMINNKTLKKEIAAKFTEDFIVKEMQSNRGISKENQLLFIYCAIGYNYNQDFYTGDDGDNNRMSEFEKVMDTIENCQTKYENEFMSYMQQISTDADRRSTEAIKKIMQQDSIRLKKSMIEFYEIYITNPKVVKKEDIDFAKESTKTIIGDCKKYGIDYRAILLKEVGDKKKVDAILKFYGVE